MRTSHFCNERSSISRINDGAIRYAICSWLKVYLFPRRYAYSLSSEKLFNLHQYRTWEIVVRLRPRRAAIFAIVMRGLSDSLIIEPFYKKIIASLSEVPSWRIWTHSFCQSDVSSMKLTTNLGDIPRCGGRQQ